MRFSQLDQDLNIGVLQHEDFGLRDVTNADVHHGAAQIIGSNDELGKESPKHGLDHAQHSVA
jgi:hypothetical protein